jgi:hypothetical protein
MIDENFWKNAARIWLAEALIAILALIALRKGNPYGYYVFLRWLACPLFLWIAWKSYVRAAATALTISACVLAVIYNPIIRVMLDRGRWELLNMAMVVIAIWSGAKSLRLHEKNKKESD